MSISLPRPVQTYLTVSHLRGFAELAEGDGAEGEDRADVGKHSAERRSRTGSSIERVVQALHETRYHSVG